MARRAQLTEEGHHGLKAQDGSQASVRGAFWRKGVCEKRWHRLLLPRLVYPVETESSPSKKNNLGSGSKTFRRQARQAKIGRQAPIHWKDFCAGQDSTNRVKRELHLLSLLKVPLGFGLRWGQGTWGAAVVCSVEPQIKMSLGLPVQPGPYLREGAVRLELLGGGGTLSEGV